MLKTKNKIKKYCNILFLENLGYKLILNKDLPKATDNYIYNQSIKSTVFSQVSPKKIKTIFDVGANIGQTATKFSQNFPQAKIFAFEPAKTTFEKLKKNTDSNPNINCFHLALGSETGKSKIYLNSNSQLNSLLNNSQATTFVLPSEEIEVKTVEQFCKANSIYEIDILKTDTEGFDLNVIKGAEYLLRNSKVLFVLSEVGFDLTDRKHTHFFSLKSYLDQYGFKFLGFYDLHYRSRGQLMYCNALWINNDFRG